VLEEDKDDEITEQARNLKTLNQYQQDISDSRTKRSSYLGKPQPVTELNRRRGQLGKQKNLEE
jgi:hypothetical protein